MTDFPSTPPPELVQQWYQEWTVHRGINRETHVATQAARWGADQELEACCDWLSSDITTAEAVKYLYADRRPKPPSLKEQSIALIDRIQGNKEMWDIRDLDVIRRALEQLDD